MLEGDMTHPYETRENYTGHRKGTQGGCPDSADKVEIVGPDGILIISS